MKQGHDGYTNVFKILHWVMALIILSLFGVGYFMTSLPANDTKWFIYGMHKSFGVIILLLVGIRLAMRLINPPRIQLYTISTLHFVLSKLSVPILYIVMLGMSVSGYVMSDAGGYTINLFGLADLPHFFSGMTELSKVAHNVHTQFAPMALGIVALHIAAALYHHYFLKNNTLKRMMFKK